MTFVYFIIEYAFRYVKKMTHLSRIELFIQIDVLNEGIRGLLLNYMTDYARQRNA